MADTTNFNTLETSLYAKFENSLLGKLKIDFHQINWDYNFAENEYEKDTLLPNSINAFQFFNIIF